MKKGAFFGIVLAAVAAIIHPAWGDVATITFGNVAHDIGNKGPVTEGAYQYNAVGTSWSIQQDYSIYIDPFVLPSDALTTFFGIPPAVGNTVAFTRLDGGTFNFLSIDIFGRLPGVTNDVVQAQGFLNGSEVATLTLQSSVQAYTTVYAGPMFSTPVDTLRLVQTQTNGSSLIMDNVVLQAVPEPASVSLIALVGMGLLARRRSGGAVVAV